MRTLSTQEITRIDQRLESLKIQYLEIHHEIRDHYFTELEKKPAEEFDATFQQLNETFAWSMVKNMEKELFKNVSDQLSTSQWEALKFWKLDFWKVLGVFLYLSLIVLAFEFFGSDAALGLSFLPPLLMMIVLLYHSGLYFSLDPNYHRPRKVLLHAAVGRYSLLFNLLNAFVVFISLILNRSGLENWALVLWILYSGFLSFYALSLLASIDLKYFKVIKN
ncbi:hypothetical protein [Algoriphagus formosus]|uniref:hypothetical protein n=1 Tax=Algoriphagus formosus TaxID=2007308 RepID=UPI003F6EC2D6